jgi:hypothetical protein
MAVYATNIVYLELLLLEPGTKIPNGFVCEITVALNTRSFEYCTSLEACYYSTNA